MASSGYRGRVNNPSTSSHTHGYGVDLACASRAPVSCDLVPKAVLSGSGGTLKMQGLMDIFRALDPLLKEVVKSRLFCLLLSLPLFAGY